MTLDTFFEKFDLFADAPNAVAKMRELVLELAVRGKLVPQDKRDQSASLLLASMISERATLVASRKIKARLTLPVEADEQPFEIPTTWAWARLYNVGYELGQKIPDRRFTYIDVGGIDSDKGCISDRVEELEPNKAPSRARKIVARGTVIYSTVRPYLLNIAIVDKDFDPEPIASTAFGILHPFVGINNRYLFYWLRSVPFTGYVQACMKGMAYPAINDEKFYSGYIPLPPLAEQKRIVAKVDELMALCDQLERQQQKRETQRDALARAALARFADAPTPENLQLLFYPPAPSSSDSSDFRLQTSSFPPPPPSSSFSIHHSPFTIHHSSSSSSSSSSSFILHPSHFLISPADLRKTILTLAVQGKLVPQDPNDEPAEELVERLAREFSPENCRRQADPHPTLPADSLQYEVPEGWTWARFRDVAIIASNLVKPNDFLDFIHLAPDNIEKGNGVLLPCATVRDDKVISANHHFYPGQLVYSKIRPNLAKVVIVDFEGLCSADMYPINSLIDAKYLHRYMLSESFLIQAVKTDTRVAMPKINQTELNALAVPVPPLAEQRRIVEKVDELMALVDRLATQIATARAAATALLEAVVAELTTRSA